MGLAASPWPWKLAISLVTFRRLSSSNPAARLLRISSWIGIGVAATQIRNLGEVPQAKERNIQIAAFPYRLCPALLSIHQRDDGRDRAAVVFRLLDCLNR